MDNASFQHDVLHGNHNDALEAIEAELGTNPSGQASTVAARISILPFNVVDYGAAGDGSTDDTTAVQAAITAANSAGGGVVFFPKGTYLCQPLTMYANVGLRGVGITSILKKKYDSGTTAYLLNADSGSSSTFIAGMSFADMQFRGTIDVDTTFNQYGHLLYLNGVTDLTISNCDFIGWHGDAIYLGSGDTPGTTERHNKRVKIIGNRFDGLTKNNRNAISVIDGDDVLIMGNSAQRHTLGSGTPMPGFVDVEPNGGSNFAVLRDIKVIGNTVRDIGGYLFQLLLSPSALTTDPGPFLIQGNTMDGQNATGSGFSYMARNRTVSDTSTRDNIRMIANTAINLSIPLDIHGGLAGIDVVDNTFVNSSVGCRVGDWNAGLRHIKFIGNTWREINTSGSDSGSVYLLMHAQKVQYRNEHYDNCGLSSGGTGCVVKFGVGADASAVSNFIDMMEPNIAGTRMTAIAVLGTHTTTAANNFKRGYKLNGLTWGATTFNGTPDA